MQYSPSNNATYDFMAFYPRIFSPATPPVTKKGIWNSTGSTSASTQSLVTFRDHSNICKLDMMRKRSCHWASSKGIHTFLLLTAYNPEQRASFRKLCWRKTVCVCVCFLFFSLIHTRCSARWHVVPDWFFVPCSFTSNSSRAPSIFVTTDSLFSGYIHIQELQVCDKHLFLVSPTSFLS